jgi:hypothetical protein
MLRVPRILKDSSTSDDEVRYRILAILYKEEKDNPEGSPGHLMGLEPKYIVKHLDIPEKQVYFNMSYLDKKGLITIMKFSGNVWSFMRITPFGIDVYENKDKYKEKLHFIQNILNISAPIYGPVIQAVASEVTYNQQLNNAFEQARIITDRRPDISGELRIETNNRLDSLEEELKKKDTDLGRVQRLWQWLKGNASWVVPVLKDLVLEVMKRSLS